MERNNMNKAPEGLEYGHDNDKFAKADCLESHLEAGKMKTGSTPSAEHEKAETMRMLDGGSNDPYYSKK
jgi:hypothetical protein